MTELILWRHDQTDHNLVSRVQGQVDIPLNATGLAQAAAAARILASPRPDRIVSSPLSRARTTAQILADLTGLDIEVEADLIERFFGVWEINPSFKFCALQKFTHIFCTFICAVYYNYFIFSQNIILPARSVQCVV